MTAGRPTNNYRPPAHRETGSGERVQTNLMVRLYDREHPIPWGYYDVLSERAVSHCC